MKTQTLIQISGMVLLAMAISFAVLALVYALLNHYLLATLASISWNA